MPPELEARDNQPYDELDGLISEAIAAANRGAFGQAEAMLEAERIRQAASGSGEVDSRLGLALQYIEQLRQSKRPHPLSRT
ncbi:MAG: hypothetical protein V3T17_04180 [Pseudomonadales bacterium]